MSRSIGEVTEDTGMVSLHDELDTMRNDCGVFITQEFLTSDS